jgi:tRNA(fMet)-specific endonuclease VapC
MTRYLLDTSVVSDLIRNPHGHVANRIQEVGEAQVATSIIVAAELRYGAAKKGSPRLIAQVEAVLGAMEILPFEEPADCAYGLLRAAIEQKGQPVGGNDLLIAAQAISLGITLVTANEREFARIPDLPCENWLV